MNESHEDSEFIQHEPCPSCGSTDNLGRYTDGHAYCFGCKHYEPPTDGSGHSDRRLGSGEGVPGNRTPPSSFVPLGGNVESIPNRRLSAETCKRWNYRVNRDDPQHPKHVATYQRAASTSPVSQKVRGAKKEFYSLGDHKHAPLYGQHLWSGDRRSLIITEGEIDALSVSQAQDHKYPVVSLPGGTGTAKKTIQREYEWLCEFEKIVLMFDTDEPGTKAARECAELLPPSKVFIATLEGFKDPNEALVAGNPGAIISAFWNAKPYRPDNIVSSSDLLDGLFDDDGAITIPYPWEDLNKMTGGGIRQGELVVITAGSGVGKSTFTKELAYHLFHTHRQPVGLIMLEESNKTTLRSLIGIHTNKDLIEDPTRISAEEYAKARAELFGERELYLYDHFGSSDVDNIINRIRYLVRACGCRWVVLDHLSILVSGTETSDERKLIDIAMTKLRTLVSETGIGLIAISHLRRPSGDKGHEDGAPVSLGQLRGSHSIAQLSDIVLGIQKPSTDAYGNSNEILVLKNRRTGKRGLGAVVEYSEETGRLHSSGF